MVISIETTTQLPTIVNDLLSLWGRFSKERPNKIPFIKLANEGFYNGLTFHRIISGFMIQGGDPDGNGTGGSKEKIEGEFDLNGIKNNISHKRGVISMARAQSYNSASSQFFIMHKDAPSLDGSYAAFGHVTEGIEIVDAICKDTKVEDDNGTVLKVNQPKIKSIKVID